MNNFIHSYVLSDKWLIRIKSVNILIALDQIMLFWVHISYLDINKIITIENKSLCSIMVSMEILTITHNCLKFDEIQNVYHHFVNMLWPF